MEQDKFTIPDYSFDNFNNFLTQVSIKLNKALINAKPKLEKFLDGLPDMINNRNQIRMKTVSIASKGWFLSFSLKDHDEDQYFSLFTDEDEEKIASFIRKFTHQIINDTVKLYPQREAFLLAALEAHQEKNYILSIPVFLAHADGILQESLGISPFMFKGSKGYKKQKIQQKLKALDLMEFFLPVFYIPELSEKFNSLKRNDILHGDPHGFDYPTEINGLKAISFVNYIAFFAKLISEH